MDRNAGTISLIVPTLSEEHSLSPTVNDSPPSMPRRSERSNKGECRSTKHMDEAYISEVVSPSSSHTTNLAYLAEVSTCCDTGIENAVDPRAYAAKTYGSDLDSSTFHQAMNAELAEEYIKAMQLEVATLVQQQTWTTVPRTEGLNVLKGTWVFKLKRLHDGTPLRFKARFCTRGDLQKEGVNFFIHMLPWSSGPLFGCYFLRF